MKIKLIVPALLGIVILSFPLFSRDEKIVIGDNLKIHSKILNEERKLLVYLPAGYENSQKRYPVLYVLDGESHFLPVSGMAAFLSDLTWMPQLIVVGVVSTERTRDFTPPSTDPEDHNFAPGNGGSKSFYRCLTEELLPAINRRYRTEPCNILAGHSFGGLFAINAMLDRSEYFTAYIAASPSVYWNHYDAHRRAKDFFLAKKNINKFLYFTCSGMEDPEVLNATKSWYDFVEIAHTYAPKNFRWKFNYLPDDEHGTTPLQTFYDGLRFVFENWKFPLGTLYRNLSVNDWKTHYEKLTTDFGYECKPPERTINRQAYRRLNEGKPDIALAMFKYNVELYPDSANAHAGLGEAYMKNGQKELAMKSLIKSLALNPGNAAVREMLNQSKNESN